MADMAVFSFVVVPITGIAGYLAGRSIIRMISFDKGYVDVFVTGCILGLGCLALYRDPEYGNRRRSDEREMYHFLASIFGVGMCIGMFMTYLYIRVS